MTRFKYIQAFFTFASESRDFVKLLYDRFPFPKLILSYSASMTLTMLAKLSHLYSHIVNRTSTNS